MTEPLLIARHGDTDLFMLPALANRHGLITGATGTGKTVTLQVMAEREERVQRHMEEPCSSEDEWADGPDAE